MKIMDGFERLESYYRLYNTIVFWGTIRWLVWMARYLNHLCLIITLDVSTYCENVSEADGFSALCANRILHHKLFPKFQFLFVNKKTVCFHVISWEGTINIGFMYSNSDTKDIYWYLTVKYLQYLQSLFIVSVYVKDLDVSSEVFVIESCRQNWRFFCPSCQVICGIRRWSVI